MDIDSDSGYFSPSCGGFWISSRFKNQKIFVCPNCGWIKAIPDDSTKFQVRIFSKTRNLSYIL